MEKIYSKANPEIVLQVIQRKKDIKLGREELMEPNYALQALSYSAQKDKIFEKHYHNSLIRETEITQEGFVVLEGEMEVTIYDIDQTEVKKIILYEGDCAIIISGGHSFKVLKDVKFYEFKNGPYNGQKSDKTYF